MGIFLLRDDDRRELLLSGRHFAIAMDEEALIFVAESCLDASAGRCVFSAPLALVRGQGAQYSPFSVELFSEIAGLAIAGAKSFGEGLPATRQELADFVAAADAIAQVKAGAVLPRTLSGVDFLFNLIARDANLTESGRVLLAALLSEAFLAQGAEWQPALSDHPARPKGSEWKAVSAFAYGINPLALTYDALEGEGWYRPGQGLQEDAGGRPILVGGDTAALAAAVAQRNPDGWQDLLATGKTPLLEDMLKKTSGNRHLRGEVYRRLASLGREKEVVELAGAFAAGADAAAIDVMALAAASLSRPLAAGEADALIARLRKAIEADPDEGALYLLLGAVYEKSSLPDPTRYAQACYRKAKEVRSWGHVGEAAGEALERLGGNP